MIIISMVRRHGKNGDECIRRALCETGQKQNENVPGTFVGEIMRAVFRYNTFFVQQRNVSLNNF